LSIPSSNCLPLSHSAVMPSSPPDLAEDASWHEDVGMTYSGLVASF